MVSYLELCQQKQTFVVILFSLFSFFFYVCKIFFFVWWLLLSHAFFSKYYEMLHHRKIFKFIAISLQIEVLSKRLCFFTFTLYINNQIESIQKVLPETHARNYNSRYINASINVRKYNFVSMLLVSRTNLGIIWHSHYNKVAKLDLLKECICVCVCLQLIWYI